MVEPCNSRVRRYRELKTLGRVVESTRIHLQTGKAIRNLKVPRVHLKGTGATVNGLFGATGRPQNEPKASPGILTVRSNAYRFPEQRDRPSQVATRSNLQCLLNQFLRAVNAHAPIMALELTGGMHFSRRP
jgi:hypothetical protein